MIALVAAVVCAALLPLVGGKLECLARVQMKHEGFIFGLFVVQAILRGRLLGLGAASIWAVAVWGAACLALILLLTPNWRVAGIPIVILGLASNAWVTLINEGMPYVTADGAELHVGRFYRAATSATTLAWMGDVVPEPSAQWLLSLGDLLLFVGVVVVVLHASTLQRPDCGA